MKCFLHIGTEKTGTTSIQEFFSINRIRLAQKGFHYIESLGLPNNRHLPIVAYNASRRDDFTKRLRLFSNDALIAFQQNVLQSFKNEIRKLLSESKVVCSSEHIQSRLTTMEEIEKLKRLLNEAGLADITVIVYLRNPSETANSLYSTAIKQGNSKLDLMQHIPPDNAYIENICNHKKTVEKFASVFGKDKMVVRLFRKDKFINHSLIDDFSNIIALNPNTDGLTIPVNQNESLSLSGMMILRNLNEKIPRIFPDGSINDCRQGLVQLISKYFSEPKFSMGKEFYAAYDSYFADSNEWIRQNYFPGEPVLFPYQIPGPSKIEISEAELKGISDFIADIWINRSNILNDKWYRFGKKSKMKKLTELCKHLLQK